MREKRGSATFVRRIEKALAPLLFLLFVILPLYLPIFRLQILGSFCVIHLTVTFFYVTVSYFTFSKLILIIFFMFVHSFTEHLPF